MTETLIALFHIWNYYLSATMRRTEPSGLAPPPHPTADTLPGPPQLASQLGTVMRRHQAYVNAYMYHTEQQDMDHLNMSYRQMGVLFQLRALGVQSVSELAAAVHLTLPAASHLLERLVQRGLIQRSENPHDRRQKQVALTDQGLQFLTDLELGGARAYTRLLQDVPSGILRKLYRCFQQLAPYLPATPGDFAKLASEPPRFTPKDSS